jgi:Tol biopolymer transport system component
MAQRSGWRLSCGGLFLALAAPGPSAQTELISQAVGGTATGSSLSLAPSVTPNGRWVAFASEAEDLLPAGVDHNAAADIYLVDRNTGAVERISVDTQGGDPDATSLTPRVSRTARQVAFLSDASDLVPGDTNGFTDAFVRDRILGTTTRVSVGPGGVQANLPSLELSLSGDGQRVAFMSVAGNLLADASGGTGGDTNGQPDVFVHDLLTGLTRRVSVASDGTEGNAESRAPAISQDGRYVAFESRATNFVTPDANNAWDIFVHDLVSGRTTRASNAQGGGQANSSSLAPSISANGSRVAFFSAATNLVSGDLNYDDDVFVLDLRSGITLLASADSAGVQGDDGSSNASISPDGRFVAFDSEAQNLAPVPGGQLVTRRVFLKNLLTGELIDAGVAPDGSPGNGVAGVPSVSRSGRVLAFQSDATNLVVQADLNRGWDVFVRLQP